LKDLKFYGFIVALVLAAGFVASPAVAEVKEVRFVRQMGLGYLQIYIMQDRKLVEKQAKALGLGEVTAQYVSLGQPTALHDALLSGSADFVAAGSAPFIILWDKSRGGVKGLTALNSQPTYLNTLNPNIHSVKDFTDQDRIAVTAVKVGHAAILLHMAADQAFGQYDKLDTLTVGLSHPEAHAALLSGKSEISAHFATPPLLYQQLEDPRVHTVLKSTDLTGGPATNSILYTTVKFHDANPGLAKAVLAAEEEATAFIATNPAEAAEIFVRLDQSALSPAFIEKILRNPEMQYTTAPQRLGVFVAFMAKVGDISKLPASWKDLFFSDIHSQSGS
jgi:NitT/TauT family transport system substrate-binding protein